MGDASKKTEKDILNRYMLEKIDYLKVGHHGSKTSTGEDFLKIIKPEYALISVAKNNLYKHPSLEVIERLEKYQVKIYQTSLDGSILINMDNEGTFTTFAP